MDKALLAYRDAVRISPMYANAHSTWPHPGLDRPRQGGRQSFREAIRLNPDEADAWTALADCLKRQGRTKEARRASAQAKNLGKPGQALPGKKAQACARGRSLAQGHE